MKKILVVTFAAVMLPTLLFAQGTINFSSTAATHYLQLYDLTRPAGMVASLWWSATDTDKTNFNSIATSTTQAGANGFLTVPTTGTTGPATAGGASAWFFIQGTYAGAPGYAGSTPVWTQATGGGGAPAGPPVNMTGWTAPLTLNAVPEPSMIALAGLGLASLLIFRRRK